MLRLLALPVAVTAVLAATGCAMADRGNESAPTSPDASTTQSTPATPGATPPESGEPSGAAPSAEQDAEEPSASDLSSSSTAAAEGDPGVPGLPQQSGASIDDVLRLGAVASWAERPTRIALSLPASSSCWAFAADPVVESPSRIVVRVEQPQPCESLDAARTYSIAVPEGVDASAELQLAVVGLEHEFTLTLPAT